MTEIQLLIIVFTLLELPMLILFGFLTKYDFVQNCPRGRVRNVCIIRLQVTRWLLEPEVLIHCTGATGVNWNGFYPDFRHIKTIRKRKNWRFVLHLNFFTHFHISRFCLHQDFKTPNPVNDSPFTKLKCVALSVCNMWRFSLFICVP